MVRVEVIAYTPTDFIEEQDVTIGRCRELVEKYSVTWVNVVDPDGRTLEELETLFAFHPLALEDAQNKAIASKVDVYEDIVFVIARTIVWAEDIDTDQLSLFIARKFIVTIHDKVFPQLEDVRIRLRRKNPKMLKSGADFLAYTILDLLVDSYFPHLDRLQSLLDRQGRIVGWLSWQREQPTMNAVLRLAPTPAVRPFIDQMYAQQVVGLSGYGFLDDTFYFEFGGYRPLSTHTQLVLGVDTTGQSPISGFGSSLCFNGSPVNGSTIRTEGGAAS